MRDWVTLIVAVCGLVAGIYAARASMRASRVNQEANQIKWVDEARKEAREAKAEAEQVKNDLATTRSDLASTKRELIEVRDLTEELTRWCMRVVAWSGDETISEAELRRMINGGPAILRAANGDLYKGRESR